MKKIYLVLGLLAIIATTSCSNNDPKEEPQAESAATPIATG